MKLVVITLTVVLLVTTGCLKQGNPAAVRELETPITLKYWRVFDGQDAFDEIIKNYKQLHPNVNIEYRKLRYEEYEQALLEAWAEGRGPDMFTVHNSWIREYETKILPMPETVELPYVVERHQRTGEIEKADYGQIKMLTPVDVRNSFAEVVYNDVVVDNQVYGLPLSVDSLVLFYNRGMFDNAQITSIPSTWVEVKEAVKRLNLQDEGGNIIQAGIALGAAQNINRATDILSLLMMQNGTDMTDSSGGRATFDQASHYAADQNYRPGVEAVRFYTDFGLPFKEVYSWNEDMPEAEQAFINGRLAMMLGYAYQIPLIRTQAAKLNIGISEAPHINSNGTDAAGTKINFAIYWVETVSKMTEYPGYAWDFLQFASSEDQVESYLTMTKKPTGLRSLINEQLDDQDIKPFANQVLTARSWYWGSNPQAVENIFKEMVEAVVAGKNTVQEAVEMAA